MTATDRDVRGLWEEAEGGDPAVLLILADALEERGEEAEAAVGLRWAAPLGKHPMLTTTKVWSWFLDTAGRADKPRPTSCSLPADVWVHDPEGHEYWVGDLVSAWRRLGWRLKEAGYA